MHEIGCLWIDGFTAGEEKLSGLFRFSGHGTDGLRARAFECRGGEPLWPQLQSALHHARDRLGGVCVAASGTGCGAALALSEQLAVDRVALILPARCGQSALFDGGLERQLYRIERYAHANLPLCVSDVLMLHSAGDPYADYLKSRGLRANSRLIDIAVPAPIALRLLEERKNALILALSGFLRTGELPKSLAENPEMCIIYG